MLACMHARPVPLMHANIKYYKLILRRCNIVLKLKL